MRVNTRMFLSDCNINKSVAVVFYYYFLASNNPLSGLYSISPQSNNAYHDRASPGMINVLTKRGVFLMQKNISHCPRTLQPIQNTSLPNFLQIPADFVPSSWQMLK